MGALLEDISSEPPKDKYDGQIEERLISNLERALAHVKEIFVDEIRRLLDDSDVFDSAISALILRLNGDISDIVRAESAFCGHMRTSLVKQVTDLMEKELASIRPVLPTQSLSNAPTDFSVSVKKMQKAFSTYERMEGSVENTPLLQPKTEDVIALETRLEQVELEIQLVQQQRLLLEKLQPNLATTCLDDQELDGIVQNMQEASTLLDDIRSLSIRKVLRKFRKTRVQLEECMKAKTEAQNAVREDDRFKDIQNRLRKIEQRRNGALS